MRLYRVGQRPFAVAADQNAVYVVGHRRVTRHDKTTGKNKTYNAAPKKRPHYDVLPNHHWVWIREAPRHIVIASCVGEIVVLNRDDLSFAASYYGTQVEEHLATIKSKYPGRMRAVSELLPLEEQRLSAVASIASMIGLTMAIRFVSDDVPGYEPEPDGILVPASPHPSHLFEVMERRVARTDKFGDLVAEIPTDEPTLRLGDKEYELPWRAESVAFSQDGLTVVVASKGGEVQEWDV